MKSDTWTNILKVTAFIFFKLICFDILFCSGRVKAIYCWDKTTSCIHELNFNQCTVENPAKLLTSLTRGGEFGCFWQQLIQILNDMSNKASLLIPSLRFVTYGLKKVLRRPSSWSSKYLISKMIIFLKTKHRNQFHCLARLTFASNVYSACLKNRNIFRAFGIKR